MQNYDKILAKFYKNCDKIKILIDMGEILTPNEIVY